MRQWLRKLTSIKVLITELVIIGLIGFTTLFLATAFSQDTSTQNFFRLKVRNGIDSTLNPDNGKNPGVFLAASVAGCATAAAQGALCNTTFTIAEPDTNAIPFCVCLGNTSGAPAVSAAVVVSATSVTCATTAASAAAAQCTNVALLMIHP